MLFEEMLRERWEDGKTAGRAEGKAEGKAESLAEAVVGILSHSHEVPLDLRNRILSESDLGTLNRWFGLALSAESLEAFLESM